jgi:hypothetical protein
VDGALARMRTEKVRVVVENRFERRRIEISCSDGLRGPGFGCCVVDVYVRRFRRVRAEDVYGVEELDDTA